MAARLNGKHNGDDIRQNMTARLNGKHSGGFTIKSGVASGAG